MKTKEIKTSICLIAMILFFVIGLSTNDLIMSKLFIGLSLFSILLFLRQIPGDSNTRLGDQPQQTTLKIDSKEATSTQQ